MLRTARVTRDGKDKEEEEAIGSGADEEEVTDEDGLAAESGAESDGSEGSASEEDDVTVTAMMMARMRVQMKKKRHPTHALRATASTQTTLTASALERTTPPYALAHTAPCLPSYPDSPHLLVQVHPLS
jgi:hypothetical protein